MTLELDLTAASGLFSFLIGKALARCARKQGWSKQRRAAIPWVALLLGGAVAGLVGALQADVSLQGALSGALGGVLAVWAHEASKLAQTGAQEPAEPAGRS